MPPALVAGFARTSFLGGFHARGRDWQASRPFLADPTGGSISEVALPVSGPVTVLVGPEGGVSDEERDALDGCRCPAGGCGAAYFTY